MNDFLSGGLSGLTSGVASLVGQHLANQTNIKLAREANALQYEMFNKANSFNRQERLETQDFNRQMMLEQQAYNTPSAQAERLRAAGINPMAVLGDSAGFAQQVSSSAASSSGVPGMHAPEVSNEFNPQSISVIMDSVLGALDKKEDIASKRLDNEIKSATKIEEIQRRKLEMAQAFENKELTKNQRIKLQKEYDVLEIQEKMLNFDKDRQKDLARMADDTFLATMRSLNDQHNKVLFDMNMDKLRFNLERFISNENLKISQGQLSAAVTNASANYMNAVSTRQKSMSDIKINDVSRDILKKQLIKEGVAADVAEKTSEWTIQQAYEDYKRTHYETRSAKAKSRIDRAAPYNPLSYLGQVLNPAGAQAVKLLLK